MIFKSKLLEFDTPTKNNRIYSKDIIERIISDSFVNEKIKDKSMFVTKMKDEEASSIDLQDICARLTDFEIDYPSKILYGIFETCPFTDYGKIVEDIIKNRGENSVEIYMYGCGDVKYDEKLRCTRITHYSLEGFYLNIRDKSSLVDLTKESNNERIVNE